MRQTLPPSSQGSSTSRGGLALRLKRQQLAQAAARELKAKTHQSAAALGVLLLLGTAPVRAEDRAEDKAPKAASAQDSMRALSILRKRLDNGLRIVLSPNPTVPTVAIAVYYDVGSRNEVKGKSGFAHLFEHMMFQGSKHVSKGEHFKLIMNRGGSMNGTTSVDRTNYYETLPSRELALGLWLEADRMRSLDISAENFENQRQTVMEERRQSYDNQPYAKSMLRINELAYGDYWPYAHSTIGDMRDLQASSLEDVQAFFDTYYAPNNAVLSVAGDFDPSTALRQIKHYFGDIPARELPDYAPGKREVPSKERRDSMLDPLAKLPALHVAYPIPPAYTKDHYALELLGLILGEGRSSRLYQHLVRGKELAQEVDVATDDRRGPDLFSFWAIANSGTTLETLLNEIDAQLATLTEKGVTEAELSKAKNVARAAFVMGLQSNMGRAMRLAEYELYQGDARLLRSDLDAYLAVSRADIARVAKQYLKRTQRTVLEVRTKESK